MRRDDIFLSIGSNIGLREELLLEAVSRLEREPPVTLTGLSPLYETEPVGVRTDNPYINAVVRIEFVGAPRNLLRLCQDLERRAGRKAPGPDRTLDIDILLFGDTLLRESDLVIPHPRLRERLFVLVPLSDLEPDLPVPPDGRRVCELVRSGGAGGWIRMISTRTLRASE